MKKIIVVHRNKIENIAVDKLKESVVGQKTLGLASIPSLWTPDFFVVSSGLINEYKKSNNKEKLINDYSNQIIRQSQVLRFGDEIILRSSASKESMEERGKYDSKVSKLINLKDNLEELIISLLASCDDDVNIAIVVQKYIVSNKLGHMSNERRFHHDARDWKIELYNNDTFSDNQIGIRKWRTTYDLEEISNTELKYSGNALLRELRKVAYYWYCSYGSKYRYHLEFVYTDSQIFIVQADCDNVNASSKNPTEYNININCKVLSKDLKILNIYNYSESNYKKLQNLKDYKDIGLPTTTLYYLNDISTLENISKGIISVELRQDLELLLSVQSIVIRSDIISDNKSERQMLPRSNELKDFLSVKKWLIDNVNTIIDKQGIFIIHNFIPAVSSAFAHAKPSGTKVEIQSLWGLPEGLYYNAHDTAIVKFPYSDLEKVNANNSFVTIKKKYKDSFVYPDDSGKWSVERIAEPYDWKCSIQDPDSIFDIAIQSQRIANSYNEEISVMWFVGIDENHFGSKNLPWFHEKIELELDSYTKDLYKRKYFTDEEFILNDQNDLEKLKLDSTNIKCVRIKPKDESILRNKDFLSEVGQIVVDKNLSILLEGAQLTHSYYQLRRTGANVVCTKSDEFEISNDMEFNKLVRDRIPEIIVAGGEAVKCRKASEALYDRLLFEKLLEEAFEVNDASNITDLKEEIADMLEVIDAISTKINHSSLCYIDFNERPIVTSSDLLFEKNLSYGTQQFYQFKFDNKYCLLTVERQKTDYRIELNISNTEIVSLKKTSAETTLLSGLKIKILKLASQLLNVRSTSKTVKLLAKLNETIREICLIASINYDEIQNIKSEKNRKRGGFVYGYILLNTSLAESYTECDVFDPNNCALQTSISKSPNKYVDFRKNEKNNSNILVMRFNVPLAVNNWGITFESKKIKEFFDFNFKLHFKFEKIHSGELKVCISAEHDTVEQLSLFDIKM